MFKSFIENRLEKYVKKYLSSHPDIKLIAISGSVGKTSTKMAIATLLNEKFRIRVHGGNHNTNISAPLAIMGIDYPKNIKNPLLWLTVFSASKKRIKQPSDVDVIIQELGSDRIGQLKRFGEYMTPDIGVVTAVSPEHMEFFKNIDNVAEEELSLANFSKEALINRDDIDDIYAKYITNPNINTYGTNSSAEYHFISDNFVIGRGNKGDFFAPELTNSIKLTIKMIGEHTLRPAIAACAVGMKLGMTQEEIAKGVLKIRAVNGRMSLLRGLNDSLIIDDSYNSSPLASEMALKTLYSIDSPQRIAVLGNMNELGEISAEEHAKIGELCKASLLAWVVTVGDEAGQYIASVAEKNGCKVKVFKNSIEAGIFVREIIEPGAVILFKGSEGGVYLEEAVKQVLRSVEDESKLVRQSADWMLKKVDFLNKEK